MHPPVALLLHPAARDRGDRLHGASEHRDRTGWAGRAVSLARPPAPGERSELLADAGPARDLLLRARADLPVAQRLAARPERRLPVQRAHGAAPRAHPRRAAHARHGHAGLDAAPRASLARSSAPVARWLTAPSRCFVIFNVVLAAWHLPPMYEYAMDASHHPHRPAPLLHDGGGADVVAGALARFPSCRGSRIRARCCTCSCSASRCRSSRCASATRITSLYPWYASAPRIWGITPMQDQMIGVADHVDPGRPLLLRDHLHRLLQVAAGRWRRDDGGGAGEGHEGRGG